MLSRWVECRSSCLPRASRDEGPLLRGCCQSPCQACSRWGAHASRKTLDELVVGVERDQPLCVTLLSRLDWPSGHRLLHDGRRRLGCSRCGRRWHLPSATAGLGCRWPLRRGQRRAVACTADKAGHSRRRRAEERRVGGRFSAALTSVWKWVPGAWRCAARAFVACCFWPAPKAGMPERVAGYAKHDCRRGMQRTAQEVCDQETA